MRDVLQSFYEELLALGVSFNDQAPVDPLARDAAGDMPLHYAAYWGRLDEVRALIAANAPVNAAGENGYTPLHYAIERDHADVVAQLIASGADSSICDALGRSARAYAADIGNADVWTALAGDPACALTRMS